MRIKNVKSCILLIGWSIFGLALPSLGSLAPLVSAEVGHDGPTPRFALNDDVLRANEYSSESSRLARTAKTLGQLAEIVVGFESRMVASPSYPDAFLPVEPIPAGGRVSLIGTDRDGAWLLVLYDNILGWIPTFYSKTPIGNLNLAVLAQKPVDACAMFLASASSAEETWVSDVDGPVVVQGIIYRSAPDSEPTKASITLQIDGAAWVSASRIVHEPVASTGDVILFSFTVQEVLAGNRIGFALHGLEHETVSFLATYSGGDCSEATPVSSPPVASDQPAEPTPIPVTSGLQEPPSSTPALPSGDTQPLGQPWEQEGVSLILTGLDIRAESDSGDAAARGAFRLFNKVGQRLLVEIDWNNIHLEDGLGNIYVDAKGGGTTSVWVEAGDSFKFERHYARQPGERSRVPSEAGAVLVVVDKFSRIRGARWQVDINPELLPIGVPSAETVKGLGEAWEQGGMALILQNIIVRAQSDSGDAAVKASYSLVNNTGERRMVEIDFSHLYVVDSFGQRFSDWDGGGLVSRWLEPGQSLDFERAYSRASGQRSRITRGAEFVLVRAERIGYLESAQWQFDILR